MVFKGQYDWEWGGLEGALCNGFDHFLQNDEKQRKVSLSRVKVIAEQLKSNSKYTQITEEKRA